MQFSPQNKGFRVGLPEIAIFTQYHLPYKHYMKHTLRVLAETPAGRRQRFWITCRSNQGRLCRA